MSEPYLSPGGLRSYDGWGRPRCFSKAEAEAYSAEVKADGRCGAMTPSKVGWCVCNTMSASDCQEEGNHTDFRHMVVWDVTEQEAAHKCVPDGPLGELESGGKPLDIAAIGH